MATCVLPAPYRGAHIYQITYYDPDGDIDVSATQVTLQVDAAPTQTTLTSNASPSVTGQPLTLTAKVGRAPEAGDGINPTQSSGGGTVTFREGEAVLCGSVTLGAQGFTCPLPAGLPTGGHDLTASWTPPGSGDQFASSTGTLHQQVDPAATEVTVTSTAPGDAALGAPVAFTASVAPLAPGAGTATGTVQFAVDGTPFGAPAPLAGGRASSPAVTGLAPGAHTITATYAGDSSFLPSVSTGLSQQVDAGAVSVAGSFFGALSVTKDTVVQGATLSGPATVAPGTSLAIVGSTLTGPLRITGASAVRICGSTLAGPVTVTGGTGPVLIGDGANPVVGCAGNRVTGPVSVTGSAGDLRVAANRIEGPLTISANTGGTELAGNTVTGPLRCSSNAPAPADGGRPNVVLGPRGGQCAAPGF